MKRLERRELRQLFGRDAPDVEWVDQLMLRLKSIPPDLDYTDKDYDDIEKARRILHRLRIKAGYDPSQPRVPAGNSDGGEWTDTGGGGSNQTGMSAGNQPAAGSEDRNSSPNKPHTPHPLRTYPRSANPSRATHVEVHSNEKITIYHADGSTETRVGGSRAWRNNNPGNLRPGDFSIRHGAIGENNKFAVFPDAATGNAAQIALLKGPSYAHLTIDAAIARRSGPKENDTPMLQREIPKRAGLSGKLTIETLKPKEFDGLLESIHHFEGWKEGTVATTHPVR